MSDPTTAAPAAPATPATPGAPASAAARLHRVGVELAALAQNGLNYDPDHYETVRYLRMRELAAEVLGVVGEADPAELVLQLAAERGHATPKVDVRGALFDGDRVLLVRERLDGGWTLPGGWADALDLPRAATEREFAEEAGLAVRTTRLAAVWDGVRHNGHSPSRWHIYKLFFLCERVDPHAEPEAGLDGETTDVGFFSVDALPPLSTPRTTEAQLRRLLEHVREPALPTDVD